MQRAEKRPARTATDGRQCRPTTVFCVVLFCRCPSIFSLGPVVRLILFFFGFVFFMAKRKNKGPTAKVQQARHSAMRTRIDSSRPSGSQNPHARRPKPNVDSRPVALVSVSCGREDGAHEVTLAINGTGSGGRRQSRAQML